MGIKNDEWFFFVTYDVINLVVVVVILVAFGAAFHKQQQPVDEVVQDLVGVLFSIFLVVCSCCRRQGRFVSHYYTTF